MSALLSSLFESSFNCPSYWSLLSIVLVLQNLVRQFLPYTYLPRLVDFSLCRWRPGMLLSLPNHGTLARGFMLKASNSRAGPDSGVRWPAWSSTIGAWHAHSVCRRTCLNCSCFVLPEQKMCSNLHPFDVQALHRICADHVKQYLYLMSCQHRYRKTIRRRPKSCAWLHNPNVTLSQSVYHSKKSNSGPAASTASIVYWSSTHLHQLFFQPCA